MCWGHQGTRSRYARADPEQTGHLLEGVTAGRGLRRRPHTSRSRWPSRRVVERLEAPVRAQLFRGNRADGTLATGAAVANDRRARSCPVSPRARSDSTVAPWPTHTVVSMLAAQRCNMTRLCGFFWFRWMTLATALAERRRCTDGAI